MSEKGTRFSQVVAASACVLHDLERLIHTQSEEDCKRLEKSVMDFRRILEDYKKHPINN